MQRMRTSTLCLFLLFNFLIASGQSRKIDSLRSLLKSAKADTNKVNLLNAIARQLNNSGNFDSALVYGVKSEKLASSINFKKGLAEAHTRIGLIYFNQENYTKSEEYASKSLADYQLIGNKAGIASSYAHIANVSSQLSNYSKALEYTFKALSIHEEIRDEKSIVYDFSNIGLNYFYLGNYADALNYDFKALPYCQKIGDKTALISILGDIGASYDGQKNYADALKYYFKSLDISKQIGNKLLCANDYNDIGTVYEVQGNDTGALEYYSKALALFLNVNYKYGVALGYANIGGIYKDQGKYTDARENNYKALDMANTLGYKVITAECYKNLGNIEAQTKNYKKAKIYFDSAVMISKEIGSKEVITNSYIGLSKLHSYMGNYKAALEDLEKYYTYHDSIINEANERKTLQTEMNYEFEQKQAAEKLEQDRKEAALHLDEIKHKAQSKVQKVLIGLIGSIAGILIMLVILIYQRMKSVEKKKIIAEQQKSWLELKALRTQMNPHFLYNTINSIQSFVLKNDTKSSVNYLAQFASLMRGVLENSRKDKITLADEIEGLYNYLDFELMRFPAKFNYQIKVDDNLDKSKVLLPPLLIQPYVENAIWHGLMHLKDGSGQVLILFEKMDEHIRCTIDDNGIGRAAASEMKNKSVHKSVGMSIVAERMESMNKMYHWDMKIGIIDKFNEDGRSAGTKVELYLPLILNTVVYD